MSVSHKRKVSAVSQDEQTASANRGMTLSPRNRAAVFDLLSPVSKEELLLLSKEELFKRLVALDQALLEEQQARFEAEKRNKELEAQRQAMKRGAH